MISKPIAPPWNDSSKNLVKDLALSGSRFTYRILTAEDYHLDAGPVICEPIYRARGSYSPPLLQNVRVLVRLLKSDETALTHFFFAPNPKSSFAARLALMARRRTTVQTVCSAPKSFARASRLLFARKVVVLSQHTLREFIQAGVEPDRLVHIPPGIQIPRHPSSRDRQEARLRYGIPADRPAIIYPGDYQFSHAAQTIARALPKLRDLRATFIFACRIKQAESRAIERQVRQMIAESGMMDRVQLLNEVDDMLELLSACDVCLLPAESLFAKMDLPLVLLEALALGLPIVVADRPPLNELLQDDVGEKVPPRDPEALASTIRRLLIAPDRLDALGSNAQRAAQARYAIGQVSQRYEDLYEELIRE